MAKASKTTFIPIAAALGALVLPTTALANVELSEIMYDPPGSDAKSEWVEIYNDGSQPVDLTGWKFIDGGSATKHTLNAPPKNGGVGSLMLPPQSYGIFADDAATFLGAYPNVDEVIDTTMDMPDVSGTSTATIELLDDTGAVEDAVTYGFDQYAANKGNSLQRQSDGSFVSALPTPEAANATVAYVPPSGDSSSDTQSSDSQNTSQTQNSLTPAPVSSYVPPPVPELFADAGGDRTVMAGADAEFDGRAYNRDQETLSGVRLSWNFGDGSVAEGPAVLHHFSYPGRYAVVLMVAQDKEAESDRITVTVEPPALAFSLLPNGGVAIENLADRDLDLSNWIVAELGRQFMLPAHSIILKGSAMNISGATLGFWSGNATELLYPNGALLLAAGQRTATSSSAAPISAVPITPTAKVAVAVSTRAAASAPAPKARSTPISKNAPAANAASTSAAAVALAPASGFSKPLELSLVGLVALIVLGAAGISYSAAAENTAEESFAEVPAAEADVLAQEFEISDETSAVRR